MVVLIWSEVLLLGLCRSGIVPSPPPFFHIEKAFCSGITLVMILIECFRYLTCTFWKEKTKTHNKTQQQTACQGSMTYCTLRANQGFVFLAQELIFDHLQWILTRSGAWSIRSLHQQAGGCRWWKQIARNELDVSSNAQKGKVNRTQSWVTGSKRRLKRERIHPCTCTSLMFTLSLYKNAALGEWRISHELVSGLLGRKATLWKIHQKSEITIGLNDVQLQIVGNIFPSTYGWDWKQAVDSSPTLDVVTQHFTS